MEELEYVTAEQPLDEEEKKLLEQIYARLDNWQQECKDYHDEARVMRQVLRLHDPDQDKGPKQKEQGETLQLHTLANTVYNSIAEQMERMPEPKLLPETPDMQDMAAQLQDVVHYVMYTVNGYEKVHRRRMEDFFTTGTCVLQVAWDETMAHGSGDIALIRWPIEALVWDPMAEDIQDARAVMKVSWHPKSWYEEHYPDKCQYICTDENMYNNVGMPDEQQDYTNDDEERALLIEYWYRKFDAARKRYSINVVYCAGHALLDKAENVYAHGEYPFIVDVHSFIEGKPVGDGMVAEFRPMMQYINKYAKYIDTNLRFSSKGRMLVRKQSGIDRAALADWSQDMIEGEAIRQGEDWAWLSHQPMQNGAANQMQQFQLALQQDAGVSSVMRGVLPSDYASGKAVVALQETGSKISNLRTTDLRAGYKHAVEQILWLMSEFYDSKRVALITGDDGRSRAVKVDMEKMFGKTKRGHTPPPPYIVQIEINNRNPLRIDQQNEMFMQAYTMAAQAQQPFPLSTLFSLLNIEGKDRLLPQIQENERQQEQMAQMAQQMEQMGQALQQAQAENEALRRGNQQITNAMANIRATTGGGIAPQNAQDPRKIASAGPAEESEDALIAGMGLNGLIP